MLWDEGRFRIWYGSCIEWEGGAESEYEFSLKYAESNDGFNWSRNGVVALGCNSPYEDAIARPHVIRENNLYKMWYSKKKGPITGWATQNQSTDKIGSGWMIWLGSTFQKVVNGIRK